MDKTRSVLAYLVLIALVGCNTTSINPTTTSIPSSTAIPTPSATVSSTPSPTETITPIPPTATPTEIPISWTSLGPEGGTILSIAIDPKTPSTLYAATQDGGIFKSTDGGSTWKGIGPVNPNSPYSSGLLAMDQADPSTLYVAGQISSILWKSTDGGENWKKIENESDSNIKNKYDITLNTLAIDPVTPTTVYEGTGSYRANPGGGLFKSIDGGNNWELMSTGIKANTFINIAIDPLAPNIIYTATDNGVYKSLDGGGTWEAANSGLNGIPVYTLTIDPATPTTLYAGSRSSGIYKSTDGGASWKAVNKGLNGGKYIFSISIDPVTPTTLYAISSNGQEMGLFKSLDSGNTWEDLQTSKIGSPTIVVIDPETPTTLYAGSNRDGMFKSIDGGVNWNQINNGLNGMDVVSLAIDPVTPQKLYAGIRNLWLYRSMDNGKDWNFSDTGATGCYAPSALVIDPARPSNLYISCDGVFKSLDAENFQQNNYTLDGKGIGILAMDPSNPRTLYAGSIGNGIFKTTNGGISWIEVNNGLMDKYAKYIISLAIDPVTPTTIYAVTLKGLFKSTNGGANWKEADTGLLFSEPTTDGSRELGINTLAINPVTPGILYAGAWQGLYISTNGGESWTRSLILGPGFISTPIVNQGLSTPNIKGTWNPGRGFVCTSGCATFQDTLDLTQDSIPILVIDPVTPTILYAGTWGNGVYKSTDGGYTWLPINNGLDNLYINTLVIDPKDPGTLYAGTQNGVYILEQGN